MVTMHSKPGGEDRIYVNTARAQAQAHWLSHSPEHLRHHTSAQQATCKPQGAHSSQRGTTSCNQHILPSEHKVDLSCILKSEEERTALQGCFEVNRLPCTTQWPEPTCPRLWPPLLVKWYISLKSLCTIQGKGLPIWWSSHTDEKALRFVCTKDIATTTVLGKLLQNHPYFSKTTKAKCKKITSI